VRYVIIIHKARCRVKPLQVIRQDSDYVSRGIVYTIRVWKLDGKLPIWKFRRWWVRMLQKLIQNYCMRLWDELSPFALKFQKIFCLNLVAFLYMELWLRSKWLRYELDGPGLESQKGRVIYLLSKASRPTSRADEACCWKGTGFFPPGCKAAVMWDW
jgi:hypothetical protein